MELIKCTHPRIIRHPLLWQFILNGFDTLVRADGRRYRFTDANKEEFAKEEKVNYYDLNILSYWQLERPDQHPDLSPTLLRHPYNWQEIKHLYFPVYRITPEEAIKYYVYDSFTGEIRPVFIVVKCNNCVLCVNSKKQRLSTRLIMEASEHSNPPMFVRLSFDNEHYPKDVSDLRQHTRPIQLFHKRLRKYFSKLGISTGFKYFVTSEYGSRNGRLHYHALYYGLHNCNYVPKEVLENS